MSTKTQNNIDNSFDVDEDFDLIQWRNFNLKWLINLAYKSFSHAVWQDDLILNNFMALFIWIKN